MMDPTGEADWGALRLDFNRRLMLQFRGAAITSDGGRSPIGSWMMRWGFTASGADALADPRTGKDGRHRLAGLLRQSVFGRLAGHEDVNDAYPLCRDPAMRWVLGDRAITGSAASASQMGRFETKWLSRPEKLAALADPPGQWIDKGQCRATTARGATLPCQLPAVRRGAELHEKLIKIGAKVVCHGRYVTFQLAEAAVSRQMLRIS
jgi:hypothetical protein